VSESNQIREYLLGSLPDAASEEFETHLFASDELLREVAEEQDALIDDYLSGDLSAEQQRSFRARVEQSSTLAHQVALHRRMLRALERQPARSYAMRPWLWAGAVGAAIAAVVFGFFPHRTQPAEVRIATVAHDAPLPRRNAPEAKPDAVFFLSSGVTRGANSLPLLKIPATATLIELQVELPADSETLRQWQLTDLDGRMPAPVAVSETKHVGAEYYVAVRLTAEALPNGDHALRLRGMPTGSPVLMRSFRVLRSELPPPSP
jgi:anti-sigma factor RsiW